MEVCIERAAGRVALTLAGALALTGCRESTSSSRCGGGSAPSLAGTYRLVSYTLGTSTIPAPPAGGTLWLTATTYQVAGTIPNPSPPPDTLSLADSGTVAISGASCISLISRWQPAPRPGFAGRFTVSGGALTLQGAAGGQASGSVWAKQ